MVIGSACRCTSFQLSSSRRPEGGREVIDEVLELVDGFGFADDELWFNGTIEALGGQGFGRLRRERPGAILQSPIDFLVPLLAMLAGWGVTRSSLDWRTPGARDVLDIVEQLGWEVNLYGVPDLDSFLEAALLLPASCDRGLQLP